MRLSAEVLAALARKTKSAAAYAAAATVAYAERARIFALRGQIVSDVNGLEGDIDWTIGLYFGAHHTSLAQFRTWVLARLPLSAKLDVLERVMDGLGVKVRAAATLVSLRRANDLRNDLAHSNVMQDLMSADLTSLEEMFRWHSARQTRQEYRLTPVEVAQLEADAEFVGRLGRDAALLWSAAMGRAQGQDPGTAMDSFEKQNRR